MGKNVASSVKVVSFLFCNPRVKGKKASSETSQV